jgi:KRAB domain-containing zinc finger protein
MGLKCNKCDRKFAYKAKLAQHKLEDHTKTDETVKRHQCDKCDYKTDKYGILKIHMDGVHSKLKKFKCTFCPQSFAQIGNFNRHLRVLHSQKKNLKCFLCDYETSSKQNLKAHHKKHFKTTITEIRQFKCDFCTLAFVEKDHLDKHLQIVHKDIALTGSFPHDVIQHQHSLKKPIHKRCFCDRCDYSTFDQNKLKIHYDGIHLGIENFSCDHCDKTFTTKATKNRHVTLIHSIEGQNDLIKEAKKDLMLVISYKIHVEY